MDAVRIDVPSNAVADFAPSYADCFRISSVAGRTASEWAHATLGAADGAFSRVVWHGILGFDLSSGAPGTLAGWPIVEDSPSRFVMQTGGRLMAGRMVFLVSDTDVQWTTALQFHGAAGSTVWAGAGPVHRMLAPRALQIGRRKLLR